MSLDIRIFCNELPMKLNFSSSDSFNFTLVQLLLQIDCLNLAFQDEKR